MTITTRNTASIGYVTNNASTLTQNQLDGNFLDQSISRDKTQHCRLILGNTDPTVPTYPTAYTTVSLIPYGGNSMFFGVGTAPLPYKNIVFSNITVTVSAATRIEGGTGITSGATAYWYADPSSGSIALKHSLTIVPVMNTVSGFLQGTGAASDMIFVGCTRATSLDTSTRTDIVEPCCSWYNCKVRLAGQAPSGFLNVMGTTLTGVTVSCFSNSNYPLTLGMEYSVSSASSTSRLQPTATITDLDYIGSSSTLHGTTAAVPTGASITSNVRGVVPINIDTLSTPYPKYGTIAFTCTLSVASTTGTWSSDFNTMVWY